MSYQTYQIEHQRLDALRLLNAASTGQLHEQFLQRLMDDMAHYLTQPELRKLMQWLAACALVSIEQIADVQVYTLTQSGRLVALGKRINAGVAHTLPVS